MLNPDVTTEEQRRRGAMDNVATVGEKQERQAGWGEKGGFSGEGEDPC